MARGRTRHWRDPDRERFWRRMVRHWRTSGLTVRDFCARESLTEPAFYHWRRELARRSGPVAGSQRQPRQGAGAAAKFLPVQVVPEEIPGARSALTVHLSSGTRLSVPAGFDRQTLADVLAALETLTETRPC